jgi:predicted P-loop ATPase
MDTNNFSISYFDRFDSKKPKTISVNDLFDLIKTGKGFLKTIDTLRKTKDKNEIDKLKKSLPAVTISGVFQNGHKKDLLVSHSGLIQIDLDKVSNIEAVKAEIEKDQYTFAVFLSPTGTGLKIIVVIPDKTDLHENVFYALEKYYLSKYRLTIDKTCKDVCRLMFLTIDENVFINKNAVLFDPEKNVDADFLFLIEQLNKNVQFKEGTRNDYVFKLATNCSKSGISKNDAEKRIIQKFSENDFLQDEIKTIVNSAFNYPQNAPKNQIISPLEKKEKSLSKLQLVGRYIKSKYEIRLNEVSCKVEFRKKESTENFIELIENNIYVELENNHFEISIAKLKALLNSDFVEKYNPFGEYFNSLPTWHKDADKDYIDQLCQYIPTKDRERFKKQFKKMLVRCIACATDDRVFNKQAFILVHEKQNSGKSTFCRWLCPPFLRDYIAENINTDKDSLIALATNFFINMDELATLSKTDLNTLKSFLSKDKVNVRMPYEAKTTIKPRRANFIGSTNKDEFLTDETGSVRWLCFELTDRINFAYSKDIEINDIWRQAYALYKDGFQYQLTPEEFEENERVNKAYTITTAEMELIPKKFKPANKEKHDLFLTASDILNEISKDNYSFKSNVYNVGKAMTVLGFQKQSNKSSNNSYTVKGYFVYTITQS